MTPLAQACQTVAARLRKDAERTLAAAERIETGADDDCFAVKHEVARIEREGGK